MQHANAKKSKIHKIKQNNIKSNINVIQLSLQSVRNDGLKYNAVINKQQEHFHFSDFLFSQRSMKIPINYLLTGRVTLLWELQGV